jgi:hypothetical protein
METLFGFDDLAPTPLPRRSCADPADLPRSGLLEGIMALNPAATAGFLGQFTDAELSLYLRHLCVAAAPRGPESVWVRPGETRAVTMRRSAA